MNEKDIEQLENLDVSNLTSEQLENLVEKLNNILNKQDIFLEEIKKQLDNIEEK